jgi:arabinofuranan 3-O-arabinosyltransferase
MPAGRINLRRSAIPAGLVAGSFALAFVQRPGKTVFDTRIELSADPSLFLHRVAQLWSSTGDLGHVQASQFVGYLFPMAPWFAFVQWTGMPMWVGQRLWLGALIALAAWGVVRLMDELYDSRRGVAHVAAGVLYAANPYVAVWTTRGSLALLAYAAVPWLMIAAHRGLLEPRSWRWPALTGLLLAASGAGVNAAIVLWVLPAPIALVIYEGLVLRVGWARVRAFAWRALVCSLVGMAWWAIPLLLASHYGTDFLSFTELPSTVWATTSISESIRLLGYWLLYLGLGGTPVVSLASTYLFSAPVIVATFAVPLFAFASTRWTRGWSYVPFFCLLAAGALLVIFAGFPSGTPLRGTLTSLYFDLKPLRFLRTSYKAAPLVGISLACLSGAGLAALARRSMSAWALAPVAALVAVLFALPLFEGRAIDRPQEYGQIPAAWRTALGDAQRDTPAGQRIMLLPGELFGFYRWGETVSSVGPALAKRPLLIREVVPYADPHAADLQNSVDDLIQQGRLVPGQLPPLLQLMGVGQVLVSADSLPDQSGALDAAATVQALAAQPGFQDPAATYGSLRTYTPKYLSGNKVTLPDLRRYDTPPRGPGIARVHPLAGGFVVDGDAQGVAELAAQGGLDVSDALFYAGDLGRSRLAGLVSRGAALVFTDSNRRRVVGTTLLRANQGATMGATDPMPRDWPSYGLFGSRGTAAQTVAQYSGLAYLRSPVDRSTGLFPEHRPYAALDGRLDTSWVPTPLAPPARRYIEFGLERPLATVPSIRVHPTSDSTGSVSQLAVSVNGGKERHFALHPGWNSLPLAARHVRTLRVRVAAVTGFDPSGGIDELQVPGLHVRESLRLPTVLASESSGLDLSHNEIAVLLDRTTADFPYRAGATARTPQAPNPADMVDAEAGLEREITLPAGRSLGISGWASVSPSAPDAAIDRLVGMSRAWSFESSGRFEGVAGRRASSAFDGNDATAWIAPLLPGRRPWLSVSAPHSFALDRFTLQRGTAEYSFPTRVNVTTREGVLSNLPVAVDGTVPLGRTIRTSTLRIEVVASKAPAAGRRLSGVAVSEVRVPGLRPPNPPRAGTFSTRCGELTVTDGGSRAGARVIGSVEALDSGAPLRLRGCGLNGRVAAPAGQSHLSAPPGGVMRPDHLALVSGAPAPIATTAPPGTVTRTSPAGRRVKLSLSGPAWLVFGQSYSSGWRASCRDASGHWNGLGAPVPIDGYANGWQVDANCREARFDFRPQRLVDAGYWASAAGCLILLALFIVPAVRRRAVVVPADGLSRSWSAAPDPLWRPRAATAVEVGILVALLGGFLFGLRAGAGLGPAAAVLLLIGVNARRLIAIATLALAAIPVLYLARPASRLTDLTPSYTSHHVAGHWAAVVALCCIAGAALVGAVRLRSQSDIPAPPPSSPVDGVHDAPEPELSTRVDR